MNKKIIFLYTILNGICDLGTAQDNFIHNSSFEDANGNPTLEGQFYPKTGTSVYPDVWESNVDENNNIINHSPDWYDVNSNVFNYRASITNGGAHIGNRYAGMHDYELLQQALFNGQSLQSGKAYIFTAYFQFSEFKINDPLSYQNSGSTLKVFISKKRIEYKSSNGNDKCTSDFVEYENGPLQSIREIASFPLSTNVYPLGGGWYKLTQLFIAPSGHDILGFEANVYDWVTIDLVNDNYIDLGQGSSCQKSYILLDDISLTEYCSHDCAPQLGSIVHSTLPTVMNGGLWQTTYKFTMENVMGFEFEVYGRWSGGVPVYHVKVFNSTGLKDPGWADYLFVWNGHNDQGNGLQQGIYDIWMKMWNCDQELLWNHYEIFIDAGASDVYQHVYDAQSYVLPSCNCVPHRYIQNTTFSADETINTQDFIVAGENVTTGTTGPVNIQHIINFNAENYIALEPGFEASIGVFNAQITPCSSFHRLRHLNPHNMDLQVNSLENVMDIYPNPSNGSILFECNNDENYQIEIFDISGLLIKKIANIKNKLTLYLDLSSGCYLYSIKSLESIKMKNGKLVIMN